jgi:hypothetical protein
MLHAGRRAYDTSEIRPINEMRMLARWKLGQALAKAERAQGARTDKGTLLTGLTKFFRPLLKSVGN